jgi:hypothetical protein
MFLQCRGGNETILFIIFKLALSLMCMSIVPCSDLCSSSVGACVYKDKQACDATQYETTSFVMINSSFPSALMGEINDRKGYNNNIYI